MPFCPSFSAFPGRHYCATARRRVPLFPPPALCSQARNKTAAAAPLRVRSRRSRSSVQSPEKNRATNYQTNHLLSIIAKVTFFSLRRRAELKIWKYGGRITLAPAGVISPFSGARPRANRGGNSFRPRETRPKGSRWSAFRISTYLLIAARSPCLFLLPSLPRDNV